MGRLKDTRDLAEAHAVVMRTARTRGSEASLAMLNEALTQMRQLGPKLSGELWDAYEAVLAAVPESDEDSRVTSLSTP